MTYKAGQMSVRCQHFQNPNAPWLLGQRRWNLSCIFYGSWDKTSGSAILNFSPCVAWGHPELSPVVRNGLPQARCFHPVDVLTLGEHRISSGVREKPRVCCVCVISYFTLPKEKMTVDQEEEMMNSERGAYCMAHNGWVMSDDPLRNFAEPGTSTSSVCLVWCRLNCCLFKCVLRPTQPPILSGTASSESHLFALCGADWTLACFEWYVNLLLKAVRLEVENGRLRWFWR